MNNLKTNIVKNKKVVISVLVALLVSGGVGGYFLYDNNRKNEILEKMSISFTDVKEIEYGTKDFDVKKELVKEIKDCELSGDVPKLDTMKIGETTLKFTLSKSDVTKEVEHTIKIVDTKAPEISLEADSKELTVGDEYDFKSNIKSVTDVVDGDIALDDKAIEVNKKATEEYSKLKKEDIKEDTKIADHKIDDFFIETTKNEEFGEEATQLYLKNCYYIDGSIDVATAGEYTVNVIAVDKNGLKTSSEFTVTVKEKEVEKAPVVNNGGGSSSSGGNTSSGGGSGSSSGGGSISRGSIQDVINTAMAQAGKTYVAGGRGPNSFDCDGLIIYSFNQHGYGISSAWSAGYSLGTNLASAQPGDIIITPNHARLYLGGQNSAQAMNPAQGIRAGFDSQIQGYQMWKAGDPNYDSDPLQILDIRRVR